GRSLLLARGGRGLEQVVLRHVLADARARANARLEVSLLAKLVEHVDDHSPRHAVRRCERARWRNGRASSQSTVKDGPAQLSVEPLRERRALRSWREDQHVRETF